MVLASLIRSIVKKMTLVTFHEILRMRWSTKLSYFCLYKKQITQDRNLNSEDITWFCLSIYKERHKMKSSYKEKFRTKHKSG